jgi:phage shock protein A
MPDEPTDEPEPAAEGEVVDDVALQPESPPSSTPVAAPVEPVDTGYTPSGVPTFDSVREKIETRYGTSIGAAELDAESPEGRTVEEQYEARQRAAAERLDEIRKSMHKDQDDAQ